MTSIWRLRAAVLVLAGALVVHQLRFALAPPAHEHEVGAVHGYLTWLMPAVAALLFVGVVQLGVRLADGPGDGEPRLPRGPTLCLAATACLLSVFVVQESIEGVVAHDRLPTMGALLAAGGWVVVPLSCAAGVAIALLLRGAAAVVRWALGRARPSPRPAVALAAVPRTPVLAPRGSVLARRMAGRAPPPRS